MQLFYRKRSSKVIAVIVGVMLAGIVLFSVCFLLAEAGHDCEGEECAVCVCMHMCENMLQRFSLGASFHVVIYLVLFSFSVALLLAGTDSVDETLVSKKIRLND